MSDQGIDEPLMFRLEVVSASLPSSKELRESAPEGLEPVSKLVHALETAEREGGQPVIMTAAPVADRVELAEAAGTGETASAAPVAHRYVLRARRTLVEATTMEALIQSMLPPEPPPVPSEAKVLQARRNAQARYELLQELGYLTAEQIADGRSRAANRHALASRWRKEGRVFAVEYNGRGLFPGFQFDAQGEPLPAIRDTLSVLPTAEMSEWEVALWWTSANGWLASRRPVDLLDGEHDQEIVEAAAKLAEPLPL